MKYILAIGLLFLSACGSGYTTITETVSVETPVDEASDFSGFYNLPNGGFIEILKLSSGAYVLYGTQRVLSVNKDLGLALHPNLPTNPMFPSGNVLSGSYSTTYSGTTNDVENDVTEVDVTGSRLTSYTISKQSGKLVIKLVVYNSAGLAVESNRTVDSL